MTIFCKLGIRQHVFLFLAIKTKSATMAKFVIAGKADCPFYARAELLADELSMRLPDFSVHKILVRPSEWNSWLKNLCEERDWEHCGGSPIIWRELINRGGKGKLLGSCNEFLEFVNGYYGIKCTKSTNDLKSVASENSATWSLIDFEKAKMLAKSDPRRIGVINAHSRLAYSFLHHLLRNDVFINEEELSLMLHTSETPDLHMLDGLKMELEDCSYAKLKNVTVQSNLEATISDKDYLIIITSAKIEQKCIQQLKIAGALMDTHLKSSCKVILTGDNSVTSLFVVSQYTSNVSVENFFAISRLAENRVKAAVAKKLKINTASVSNTVVWGGAGNYIIDLTNAVAKGYDGAIWAPHIDTYSHIVKDMLFDKTWITEELPKVLFSDEPNNDLAAAAALISQLKDIINPSRDGIFSLGLISKGWYNVPKGTAFSFPVIYKNGEIKVKESLNYSDDFKDKIKSTAEEFLRKCRELIQPHIHDLEANSEGKEF